MKKRNLHLLVISLLIIWKTLSADWVVDIPWIDYVESRGFTMSVSAPNSFVWSPPTWVLDTEDPRYYPWYFKVDHPFMVASGASHPTGEGVLKLCWSKVIIKILSAYILFIACYRIYTRIKPIKMENKAQ